MSLAVTFSEYTVNGSIWTYDAKANAGCVNVRPAPDGYAVARTVEVDGVALVIDLDSDGFVRGVESLRGAVTEHDLIKVLRCCRWVDPE